jgi:hypothetical protein
MNHSESGLNPSKGQTAETKSPLSLLQSLLPPGDATLTERHPDLERRKDERMPIDITAKWDYFTLQSGTKTDRIANLSRSGALLCCDYPIELRRWIRLSISAQPAAPETNPVSTILVGRVVRRKKSPSLTSHTRETWEHGIQFLQATHPVLEELLTGTIQKVNGPDSVN